MITIRLTILFLVIAAAILPAGTVSAQTARIAEIVVEKNFDFINDDLVINQSGLKVGSPLSADNASEAIKRLWHLELFSDVQILSEDVEDGVRVTIKVEVLNQVNDITTSGFDEIKSEEALSTIRLVRNYMIGDRKVIRMRQQILDMYREKGFLLAKVDFAIKPVPDDSSKVDVSITVVEGKKVKIRSIDVEGNEFVSDGDIKKQMETKEDRWYRSGEYKEDVFELDKQRIVEFYKSKGYRDAVVLRDSLRYDEGSGKVDVALFVSEGKQYKFGTTSIDGNTEFDSDTLRGIIKYQEGDTFNETLIQLAQYEIYMQYTNNGFLQTYIDPVQLAHGDTVDVHFDIAEGNVSTINKVIIEGNTKTKDKVIRREITMLPGDSFSRDKLDRSRQELLMLNYFDPTGVNFEYEPSNEPDKVNIKVRVTERSTGMASMGAGYSERDKLVGTLSFSNSNLFGNGQGINFSWDMGSRRKAFQVGFSEPWFLDTPTSLSFDVYNIVRSDYTSAFSEERRRGGYVRVGRRLDRWLDHGRAYLSYRLEDVDYSDPSEYYQYYLVTGKTSSVSLMLLRDSRDYPQFATRGAQTSATVEIAGGPLGGDLSYYKYLLNNEIYTPIFWQLTLVGRTRLGFLKGYKENTWVPYSERFMPGGTSYDGFVRGYPNRQVGPLIRGEEIGGETMFVTNIELQIPIVQQSIYGILFYDFGNAWESLSDTNPFDLKRSAGIGARLYVPQLGLIGFDLGYGFDKLPGYDKVGGWKTHFQFGNMAMY